MVENNTLVSIVVLTYNSSNFVIETLESIKNQIYQNIELIISDDFSSDNTVEICKEWIEKNEYRFLRKEILTADENTGIPKNCNRAIDSCSGSWLMLVAGDDILVDSCIYDYISFVNSSDFNQNTKMIYSNLLYFYDEKPTEFNYENKGRIKLLKDFSELSIDNKLRFYARRPIFLNTPTWFINNESDFRFNENYFLLEDQTFVFDVLNKNGNIEYIDKITIKYRRHSNSVQNNLGLKLAYEFYLCYFEYRKSLLMNKSIIDLLFKFHFYLNNYSHSSKGIKKNIIHIIYELNPVKFFKINPSIFLKNNLF